MLKTFADITDRQLFVEVSGTKSKFLTTLLALVPALQLADFKSIKLITIICHQTHGTSFSFKQTLTEICQYNLFTSENRLVRKRLRTR